MPDAELVADPGHNEIHQILNPARAGVEPRHGRQYRHPGGWTVLNPGGGTARGSRDGDVPGTHRPADLAAEDGDERSDRGVEELVGVGFRPDLLGGVIRQEELPGVSLAAWVGSSVALAPVTSNSA